MQSARVSRSPYRKSTTTASQGTRHSSVTTLAHQAKSSAPALQMQRLQRLADQSVTQLYKTSRADDGGNFIGEPAACHLHIDISNPHFKYGRDNGSRMNFGTQLHRMQSVWEQLKAGYQGKAGYDDCIEWLEEQGCKAQPVKTLIEHGIDQDTYPPKLRSGMKFRDENGTVHTV